MSIEGEGCGVDLVACMQPSGGLQGAWLMFDYCKHVLGWTTMACHVYDPNYVKVVTILVCDMQSKDVDSQVFMWKALIKVLHLHPFIESCNSCKIKHVF
jgi:hypothetical protein